MSRDYWLFLDDIRESCEKILRYTQGMAKAQFEADEKTLDATGTQHLVCRIGHGCVRRVAIQEQVSPMPGPGDDHLEAPQGPLILTSFGLDIPLPVGQGRAVRSAW